MLWLVSWLEAYEFVEMLGAFPSIPLLMWMYTVLLFFSLLAAGVGVVQYFQSILCQYPAIAIV